MNVETFALMKALGGSGGGGVEVESLSVTENGTYTAEQGKAYSPVTVDVQGSSVNPQFVTLRVTNTRTAGTSAAQKKVTFYTLSYLSDGNVIKTGISSVLSTKTKDINIPTIQASDYRFLMFTQASGTEPTITSDYVTLVGHCVFGSTRYTILQIDLSVYQDVMTLTVGE